MYKDLKDYTPNNIEFCVEEAIKEKFPAELDFCALEGANCEKVSDVMKLIAKDFCATFPENEVVMRNMDDFEKQNIREEYCELEENVVPERLAHLNETLEKIKTMKKQAEDMYQSALMEIAKYAAEVKRGTKEMRLKSTETFCIALSGYYVIYTWDANKQKMVLAKAFEIPDKSEMWANDEKNRAAMMSFFGLDFPAPEQKKQNEDEDETDGDNLPFGKGE